VNSETDGFVTAAMAITILWAIAAAITIGYYVWKRVRGDD
jgi:hypothetical protein